MGCNSKETHLTSNKIYVGDAIVPYNENFKLFIVCRFSHPHFAPELCAKVNIINFEVTLHGLEDELLAIGNINGLLFFHLLTIRSGSRRKARP